VGCTGLYFHHAAIGGGVRSFSFACSASTAAVRARDAKRYSTVGICLARPRTLSTQSARTRRETRHTPPSQEGWSCKSARFPIYLAAGLALLKDIKCAPVPGLARQRWGDGRVRGATPPPDQFWYSIAPVCRFTLSRCTSELSTVTMSAVMVPSSDFTSPTFTLLLLRRSSWASR
jgi:hypothetical protein